jgi:hypothetical protein
MEELVKSLDDVTAIRILGILARRSTGDFQTELTPEIVRVLRNEFDVSPEPGQTSKGDLARQALVVLAQNSETREAIARLNISTPPQSFEPVSTVALLAAALIALQTHVRFERDSEGKITLLIEKKETKDSLLKSLAQKLLNYFQGGPVS